MEDILLIPFGYHNLKVLQKSLLGLVTCPPNLIYKFTTSVRASETTVLRSVGGRSGSVECQNQLGSACIFYGGTGRTRPSRVVFFQIPQLGPLEWFPKH
jgi:hypothetical protein